MLQIIEVRAIRGHFFNFNLIRRHSARIKSGNNMAKLMDRDALPRKYPKLTSTGWENIMPFGNSSVLIEGKFVSPVEQARYGYENMPFQRFWSFSRLLTPNPWIKPDSMFKMTISPYFAIQFMLPIMKESFRFPAVVQLKTHPCGQCSRSKLDVVL
jgi:hypothetical protein